MLYNGVRHVGTTIKAPVQSPSTATDQWAVMLDGRRFVYKAFKAAGDSATFYNPFTVVVNWKNMLGTRD